MANEIFTRLISLYGEENFRKLQQAKIAVVGLGGVGSFCATALARSAIGSLILVDFDKIDKSNINRQEFANIKTVGQNKVDAAETFLKNINSQISLIKHCEKISAQNVNTIFQNVDYIIDAIDDVHAKIALAKFAEENNISIISCMGTAKRTDPFQFRFSDIYKTHTCPLCKSFRKKAKIAGIKHLKVLYSTQPAVKTSNKQLGSTSYIPPIAGMMLAGEVIQNITDN